MDLELPCATLYTTWSTPAGSATVARDSPFASPGLPEGPGVQEGGACRAKGLADGIPHHKRPLTAGGRSGEELDNLLGLPSVLRSEVS